jgi:Zn-dependent protease
MKKLIIAAAVGFVCLAVVMAAGFALVLGTDVPTDYLPAVLVGAFAAAALGAVAVFRRFEADPANAPASHGGDVSSLDDEASGGIDTPAASDSLIRDAWLTAEDEPPDSDAPDSDAPDSDAPDSDAPHAEPADSTPPSPVTSTVLDELERLEGPTGNLRHAIMVLLLSVVVFFALESQGSASITFVVNLVIVLAIHEAGHWVAMKLFGYRDLKVFFIPMLGAAVSGDNRTATGTQRAIVSLAGPVPGMFLAVVLAFGGGLMGGGVSEDFLIMMFGVNALNLLPFEPLDGGRLMNVLVYQRFPQVESAMRVLAAVAIVSAAVAFEDIFLGLFGASFAIGLARASRIAHAARSLQDALTEGELSSPALPAERRALVARLATDEVLVGVDVYAQPKLLAGAMNDLWRKALIRPPTSLATALLLTFYIAMMGSISLLFI